MRRWVDSTTGRGWRLTIFLFHPCGKGVIFPSFCPRSALCFARDRAYRNPHLKGNSKMKGDSYLQRLHEKLTRYRGPFFTLALPPVMISSCLGTRAFWIPMSGFRVLLPPVPYWLRAEPRSTNSEFREGCGDPQRSYGIMSNVSLLASILWI